MGLRARSRHQINFSIYYKIVGKLKPFVLAFGFYNWRYGFVT